MVASWGAVVCLSVELTQDTQSPPPMAARLKRSRRSSEVRTASRWRDVQRILAVALVVNTSVTRTWTQTVVPHRRLPTERTHVGQGTCAAKEKCRGRPPHQPNPTVSHHFCEKSVHKATGTTAANHRQTGRHATDGNVPGARK